MKRFLFTTCLCLAMIVSGWAQSTNDKAKEVAAKQTEWMKENLNLTQDQLPEIETLNLEYAQKWTEVQKLESRRSKWQKAKSLSEEKDGKLKNILTEEQYKTYQAKKEELRKTAKENYKSQRANNQ